MKKINQEFDSFSSGIISAVHSGIFDVATDDLFGKKDCMDFANKTKFAGQPLKVASCLK